MAGRVLRIEDVRGGLQLSEGDLTAGHRTGTQKELGGKRKKQKPMGKESRSTGFKGGTRMRYSGDILPSGFPTWLQFGIT